MHDSPTMVHKLISYLFCVADSAISKTFALRSSGAFSSSPKTILRSSSSSPSHGAEPPIVAIEGRGGADALSTAGSPSLTSLSSLPPSVVLLFAAILRPIFTDISPVRHEVFPRRNCDPTPILGW